MCPQPRKPIRYAIYTRQSVDKSDGFPSCEAQFLTCQDFAQAAGSPDDQWIGYRLDDVGHSGATLNRPAMAKLRKVIETGGIDRLYVLALDRLSRSLRDVVKVLSEFKLAGVELRIVHHPELTLGAEDRLILHVLAAFAEFERDMIVDRLADTRAYLRNHGRRLAGPPPLGYDADPVTKQLVPNRAEARRVRLIFRRAARGQTPAEIARRINHLKWRTKQRLSRRSGKLVGGGKWTARQVTLLLRNPVYLGKFADGKGTRDGCHKPIVDAGLFDKVRQQLDSRLTSESLRRTPQDFPLRGKVLCPKCRRPLSTYMITKRAGAKSKFVLNYYRCRSTAGGRAPCCGVSYRAWELEQFILGQLAEDATWVQLIGAASQSPAAATSCRAVWQSLNDVKQRQLLPGLVEAVEFAKKNTEIRINYSPKFFEALLQSKVLDTQPS